MGKPTAMHECREACFSMGRTCEICNVECYRRGWSAQQASADNKRLVKQQKREKPNVVLVQWHDARFYPETRTKENIASIRMALFTSVGHLVRQDATTTIIAAEINDEGDYRDVTLIPSGSITAIRRLTLGPLV